MGFCLFNNVAVAARFIQKQKWGERVLIVDWDVHHGNGTQDIFWADPNVAYFSAHRYPFYPGTGSMEEIGAGAGEGLTFNLPLSPDFDLKKKMGLIEKYIHDISKNVKPDWILISCGFDAYSGDPIGGLGFEAETYAHLTRVVREAAAEFSQGRIVSVLEGGYALEALGQLAEAHIRELI
jgi:acetoin utilization deacetylase AcuC-like enzyme